jgi:hypothetical protein
LAYSALPWPVTTASFYTIFGVTLFSLATILLLFYQVYANGAVTSLMLLRVGRFVMSLCATILFFPILETFLASYQIAIKGAFHGMALTDELAAAVSIERLVISGVALISFYIPVLLFTYLYICPDPNEKSDFTAKTTTRPEVLDIIGTLSLALAL